MQIISMAALFESIGKKNDKTIKRNRKKLYSNIVSINAVFPMAPHAVSSAWSFSFRMKYHLSIRSYCQHMCENVTDFACMCVSFVLVESPSAIVVCFLCSAYSARIFATLFLFHLLGILLTTKNICR